MPKMPTDKQTSSMKLYANLMEEAKIRLVCIESTLNSKLNIPGDITNEYCFLQLRMLCEIIALGCLTAHGDIENTTKLRKEFAADKIINLLEKLHIDFYPLPVEATNTKTGGLHLEEITTNYLSKVELLTLYRKCGDVLHRGNMKKLLSSKSPIKTNFKDVISWHKKIMLLLKVHRILLINKQVIICQMHSAEHKCVRVAFAST